MASLDEFLYMSDAILPFLERPPPLNPTDQHSYLVASLEFAYAAVELVEAQLERSLRAAQDGLAAALTEGEILEMERLLIAEQQKMDDMKASCRLRTQRIMESKHRKKSLNHAPKSPGTCDKTKPKKGRA
ncbi:hypothetical protein H2248_002207 [Termitomyces sp. 'cryptogamus']|nr:hypothetical protein H2248_002207 [Termitomyces sp. 'cryptogamus']